MKRTKHGSFCHWTRLQSPRNFDYPLGNTLPFAIDLDGDDSKIINQYDNETYIGLLRTMHSWYKQGLIQVTLQRAIRIIH